MIDDPGGIAVPLRSATPSALRVFLECMVRDALYPLAFLLRL